MEPMDFFIFSLQTKKQNKRGQISKKKCCSDFTLVSLNPIYDFFVGCIQCEGEMTPVNPVTRPKKSQSHPVNHENQKTSGNQKKSRKSPKNHENHKKITKDTTKFRKS